MAVCGSQGAAGPSNGSNSAMMLTSSHGRFELKCDGTR